MTRKKKDNPAALAVMGVILVVALFSVGRSLFSGDAPQAIHAVAAATGATSESAPVVTGPIPASERDPFSSGLLQKAALLQAGPGRAPVPQPVVVPPEMSVRRPVPPPLTPPPTVRTVLVEPRAAAKSSAPLGEDENTLARTLRVTAIVMGAHPYAVLEPVGSTPRTVHAGENYHGLRLVAIRAGEIVLKGQSGLWTLPLATPENEASRDESKN